MTRAAILLLLAPVAGLCQSPAQLQLLLVQGSQLTPLTSGSTYSLGQVAAGASYDFIVRAQNNGTAPITIAPNNPALSGTGFSITSPPPDSQPNIAPGSFLGLYIHFAGGAPAAYSASFQFNAILVYFVITAAPAATLNVSPSQTCTDSNNVIGLGNIVEGQAAPCTFVLQNQSSQALTVSGVTVTGVGFLLSQPPATPLTLPVGTSSSFTITFAPTAATSYSGALTISTQGLTQTFPLTGTAYNPPLPTPALQFDTKTAQSSQQVTLTMIFPTPAPVAASGYVGLTFQPGASVSALATADPTIMFITNGPRSVPFSIQQGSTQATFAGQPGVVFQTGTTTGTITFTATAISGVQFTSVPMASLTLAPLEVQIDSATAAAIAGDLEISITGFDNTHSAGAMSFTFYDNSGKQIGSGPIMADFGTQFLSYFKTSTDGGEFQMLITFPVVGNAAEVGSVNVQLTNSAGTTTISKLAFINDSGSCVLVGNTLSCPGTPTQ